MKKVILVALLVPYLASGQIVENFEQGNSDRWVQSTPGRWKADGSEALSGNFSLHHIFDNPDGGTDRICFPLINLHPDEGTTRWTFIVRHGYDPSSSNNWAVFLMSDAAPESLSPEGTTNGFAIGVNITGYDDTLRLVRIKGTSVTTVVNCGINWQNNIGISLAAKIVAVRSPDGLWSASVYSLNGVLLRSSSGAESELFNPAWFGIFYRYSSTRDRLLWIDDVTIEGTFHEDNDPPSIISCSPIGNNSLQVILNEPLSEASAVPENFSLNTEGNRAKAAVKKSETIYLLEFPCNVKNKQENNLIVKNLCDREGNCSADYHILFMPVRAETGDVVITEIMADPLPEVSLPAKEYIEITNRTKFSYNLKDWKLTSSDQSFALNELTISPGEIIILCQSGDTSVFCRYGRVSGMRQFPLLTDGGKIICLTDSTGMLIHGVEYSSEWYDDDLKKEGGWSLEMADTDFPFSGKENWKCSVSRNGGTPGKVNSVACSNPDILFSGIINVFPEDSTGVFVTFSEPVINLPGNLMSIKISGMKVTGISNVDPLFRLFRVTPKETLKPGEVFMIEISDDITDFAGNPAQKVSFSFGLTEPAATGDMMFNELLFNPFPGDPDYVELFNSSDKIIDASRLSLVSVNESGDRSPLYKVSDENRCIIPGAYYAFTTDRNRITERYYSSQPENVFNSGGFPSMPDDKGHLVLYNRQLDIIDEVQYSEKMQYSLLSVFEGVALEKISPVINSSDAVNWHSATGSCGWGTPGAPNSVFSEVATEDNVNLSSKRISPNGDGFEDILLISFNLSGNSNVISATVFDETGGPVKKLANNLLAGNEASLLWDGTSGDGSLVYNGLYIILITLFDDTGKTKSWKKVCAVVGR
jgi:hypothetical protein